MHVYGYVAHTPGRTDPADLETKGTEMPFIKEQGSLEYLVLDLLYSLGAFAVVLIVLALGFIDMGLVRAKNAFDTWLQKIVAGLIAAAGTIFVGYAIWQWQFNQAFGVKNPLGQAVKDWWLGGTFQTEFAGNIDPKILPEADVLQIFVVFFATFSMATMALIHSGAMERLKPKPLYTMAAIIGLFLSPLAAYLAWGPVGPLTNHGTHDFDGIFPLYIFSGTWVLVLSWRLRPRLGAFDAHPSGVGPRPHNLGLVAAGVLLIMFALPLVVLSSGFIIPESGFYGISFTSSGWGIVLINIITSFAGGGMVGAYIAYKRKEPIWALLGPLSGSIICGTLYDVGMPWEVFLLSLFGPPVALLTGGLMRRLRIDEQKVIPLALGPGVVGAIAVGFIEWGTPTGGYPGLEGAYALQHAEISPWMQLAGVAAVMLVAGVPCYLLCLFFERFGGLRVTEAEEIAGADRTYWGISNYEVETLRTEGELEAPHAAAPGSDDSPLVGGPAR
jgi:ammonia channel protein AmtB